MLHDNLSVNTAGHLTFGGLDTTELAAEYGTPLYLLDEDKVRANCQVYMNAIRENFREGSAALYAGKALCFKGIYPVVKEEGMGADVVSAGEIFTALEGGFPAEKMFFHGTNKTDEEIRYGLNKGVGYFVVDNLSELHVLSEEATAMGKTQNVLLRITVGLDPHTLEAINTGRVDSQFGVPIETGQALDFVKEALSLPGIHVSGFHSHIGSSIHESQPFFDQIDRLFAFAVEVRTETGYTAEVFNLGGGFGVRYIESDPTTDIAGNIAEIASHLKAGCAANDYAEPLIFMEPGRSIAGDAGITLYSAGGIKEIPGYRSYVTVDGGMTDNPRYALYKADYTICNASRMNEPADFECTVAGRCCESGDRLAEGIQIAKPERGDIIAVLTTGAYNYSMASNYNRVCRPAMVMVSKGTDRLAVRRERFEDLIRCEL